MNTLQYITMQLWSVTLIIDSYVGKCLYEYFICPITDV